MIIYDGTSSIDWFYDGTKTREEMDGDAHYPQDGRAVLYDNGAGSVYSWALLDVLCERYGVEPTDDAQADYDSVVAAMNAPQPQVPTIEEVDEKATDAQAIANSVQDQMNALTSAFATEDDANA